ncbi:hypothetical protein Tco_0783069 [Tanacetum coccineum]
MKKSWTRLDYGVGTPGYYNKKDTRPSFGERKSSLKETINKYLEEAAKKQTERDKQLRKFQVNTDVNLKSHDEAIKYLDTKIGLLTNDVQAKITGGAPMMNGKKSLTLNFKTFYKATSLDYNEGTYVSHTFSKAMKAELARIKTDEVLGGNYSSTVHVNSIQQLIVYCLVTRTKVDIEKINYSDLITKLTYKSRQKYVSYPRFVSCALEVLLGTEYTLDEIFGSLPNVLSNSNFTKNPSKVTPIELTTSMIAVNNLESLGPDASRTLPQNRKQPKTQKRPVVQGLRFLFFEKKKKTTSQTVYKPKSKTRGPEASGTLP